MTKQASRTTPLLVAILSVLICLAGGLAAGTRADAAAALPPVLPSLQQWSAGSGSGYAWTGGSKIVVNPAAASVLMHDAHTFADDLGLDLNGPTPLVVAGPLASAAPGDIFLSLGSTDARLGTEGYALNVAPVLQVNARAEAGAFWGTRTILQLLRQSLSLPAGTARDWPQYPVRSVLVDNGSRTFPVGFWRNEIRELSYLKLNELMVYVSGLGLSDVQLRELSAFADKYHVNLVGQVNMPGHMDTANEGIPTQYELTDAAGAPIPGALDMTNPAAVTWAHQLFAKYVGLFSTPIWHTGGDEYALYNKKMNDPADLPKLASYATSKYGQDGTIEDVYRAFMNQMDDLAHQNGKSLRIWNDDLYPSSVVSLNKDITVEYWLHGGSLTPGEIAADGNQLINATDNYLYYDEGAPGTWNTTGQNIWQNFNPGVFEGNQTLPGGATDPHLSGIKLSSWDVAHMDAGLLERALEPLQQALAQRAWGSAELYPAWAQMAPALDAIGRAPGFVATPVAPGATSLPSSKAIVFDNAQNTYTVQGDGSIAHTYYSYGAGGSYTTEVIAPAGSAAGQPTAFSSGGQQHVFARGPDGHLHHWVTSTLSGGWAEDDWTAKAAADGSPSLDLAGDPAGFMYGTEQDVFGRGTDGHLHHWAYNPARGTVTADDWGGQLTADPSAVVWGYVKNVFGRTAGGQLGIWSSDPSHQGSVQQEDLTGPQLAPRTAPAVMVDNANELHVFAGDAAGHLQHWLFAQQGGQPTLEDLTAATGLSIAGSPSGFVYDTQQHVFFRDAATGDLDHVWTKAGFAPASQDWSTVTPGGVTSIVGTPWSDNVNNAEQHAFGIDTSGHVHHWFWRESDNALHQDTWQQ